jgi:glutathione S-transferase
MTGQRTLLAFAPMINCEATRCVLEHYRLTYREVDRLFGWANILTLFHGGYGEVPVFYGRGVRLSGPYPIVRRFDAKLGSPRLLPLEQPLRGQIEAEWKLFHNGLSSGVAPLAYYHLLPRTKAMIKSFGEPISPIGRAMLPLIYPGLRALLNALLRLTPARIDDCRTRIEAILDRVDRRLADHRYMVGDRLTLADIGMASASAPILLPPHYAKWVPPPADLQPAFAALVAETRLRPCAAYVDRIYAELGARTKTTAASPPSVGKGVLARVA